MILIHMYSDSSAIVFWRSFLLSLSLYGAVWANSFKCFTAVKSGSWEPHFCCK